MPFTGWQIANGVPHALPSFDPPRHVSSSISPYYPQEEEEALVASSSSNDQAYQSTTTKTIATMASNKDERSQTAFSLPPTSSTFSSSSNDSVPRPPNSWILYRAAKHREVRQAQYANAQLAGQNNAQVKAPSQAEISRMISAMWRNEDPETKKLYEEIADMRKRLHHAAYPNYRYKPNRQAKAGKSAASASAKLDAEPAMRPATWSKTTTAGPQTFSMSPYIDTRFPPTTTRIGNIRDRAYPSKPHALRERGSKPDLRRKHFTTTEDVTWLAGEEARQQPRHSSTDANVPGFALTSPSTEGSQSASIWPYPYSPSSPLPLTGGVSSGANIQHDSTFVSTLKHANFSTYVPGCNGSSSNNNSSDAILPAASRRDSDRSSTSATAMSTIKSTRSPQSPSSSNSLDYHNVDFSPSSFPDVSSYFTEDAGAGALGCAHNTSQQEQYQTGLTHSSNETFPGRHQHRQLTPRGRHTLPQHTFAPQQHQHRESFKAQQDLQPGLSRLQQTQMQPLQAHQQSSSPNYSQTHPSQQHSQSYLHQHSPLSPFRQQQQQQQEQPNQSQSHTQMHPQTSPHSQREHVDARRPAIYPNSVPLHMSQTGRGSGFVEEPMASGPSLRASSPAPPSHSSFLSSSFRSQAPQQPAEASNAMSLPSFANFPTHSHIIGEAFGGVLPVQPLEKGANIGRLEGDTSFGPVGDIHSRHFMQIGVHQQQHQQPTLASASDGTFALPPVEQSHMTSFHSPA